jgi:PadR family transcriptional regulator PadR
MCRVIVLEAVSESCVRSRLADMWVGSRRTVATTPNDEYTAYIQAAIEPSAPQPRLDPAVRPTRSRPEARVTSRSCRLLRVRGVAVPRPAPASAISSRTGRQPHGTGQPRTGPPRAEPSPPDSDKDSKENRDLTCLERPVHIPSRLSVETLVAAAAGQLALVKGTLDVLVLKALSWGPMHGFEVTTWLEDSSGGALDVDDSALYHALHRMEERGLIAADWGVTENNRRARYYSVTATGRAHLRAETARWLRYSELVSGILTAASRTAAAR